MDLWRNWKYAADLKSASSNGVSVRVRSGLPILNNLNIKNQKKEMKSIITFICAIVATSTFAFGFGNGRCNNLHSKETGNDGRSTCITVIDTLRAWNGQPIGQFLEIKGHEYIIVRSSSAVQIIHAESCPCKTK